MSNQQIGQVIGGVIGYFTGGIGYVAIGATLGGVAGSLLTPKEKTEGPRLNDLKVQVSTYGTGIPVPYGTERIGGNVVWSTDKIEIPTTTSAGKGGGVENTSYQYVVHMRIVLCEKPRDGSTVSIVQIFEDGKLKWDARSGIPIGAALASAESPYSFFELYQGGATQLPDAVEEIYSGGPGSVPAYRGVVSIAMRAVNCPGGRVPQFSFVLAGGATAGPVVTQQIDSDPHGTHTGAIIRADGVWEYTAVDNPPVFDMAYSFGHTGTLQVAGSVSFPNGGYAPYPIAGATATPQVINPYTNGDLYLIDLQSRARTLLYNGGADVPGVFFGRAAYDASLDLFVLSGANGEVHPGNQPVIVSRSGIGITCDAVAGNGHGGALGFYGGVVHVVTTNGTSLIYSRRTSAGLADASMPDTAGPTISFTAKWSALHVDAGGVFLYAVTEDGVGSYIYKITPATVSSPGAFTLLWSGATSSTFGGTVSKTFYCTDTLATIGPILTGTTGYNLIRFAAITPAAVKAKDIIADQCERAGETRYDVTGIPDADTLHGYKIQNPASARANIDPLLTAFGIYIVDEDGLIKFKKYEDITSVATIAYDELGQSEDGSEPADAMPLARAQEIDLPRSVTVTYIEETFDYQTASEPEQRQITESTEDVTIELPIATNSNHAKRVAQMVLFARWRQQNTRSLKVSRKYAFLSPGDGVTVEYPQGTFRLWRIMSQTDTGALIEMTVEPGDAELFTQTALGATGYVRQAVEPLAAPTRAQILDMPIVRDEDNDAGLYVAMDSYASVPAQAELLVGDTDANLELRGTVSASSPIGFAETILGNVTRTGFVDEANLVTINIGDDTFSSVTRDVLLAGGAQYWAYGAPGRWEIGASAQANSLGSGRYTLSRHLRGLYGTERNTGNHAIGDVFVLLRQVGILRPSSGVGAIGQTKSYRAITKGRGHDSAASQAYANTGEGLMPLSPINLRRSNTNDLSVDRRSRLAMNNLTGALPLGEASEAWSWEFYTSGAFTTLIGTATTTTATITAAQQAAIGVTPTATAFVRVRQISDSVGAGHELQATA